MITDLHAVQLPVRHIQHGILRDGDGANALKLRRATAEALSQLTEVVPVPCKHLRVTGTGTACSTNGVNALGRVISVQAAREITMADALDGT